MLALLQPLVGLAKGWLEGRTKRQAARQKTELAIEQRRTEMAAARGEHDADWELETLRQPDRQMRRVLASLILLPVVVTVIAPEHAGVMWERLRSVPGEYYALIGIVVSFYFASRKAPEVIGRLSQALSRKGKA